MGDEPLAAGSANGLRALALVPRAFYQNSFSDPTVTLSGLRWRDKFGMLANDRGIVRVAMYHECTFNMAVTGAPREETREHDNDDEPKSPGRIWAGESRQY